MLPPHYVVIFFGKQKSVIYVFHVRTHFCELKICSKQTIFEWEQSVLDLLKLKYTLRNRNFLLLKILALMLIWWLFKSFSHFSFTFQICYKIPLYFYCTAICQLFRSVSCFFQILECHIGLERDEFTIFLSVHVFNSLDFLPSFDMDQILVMSCSPFWLYKIYSLTVLCRAYWGRGSNKIKNWEILDENSVPLRG